MSAKPLRVDALKKAGASRGAAALDLRIEYLPVTALKSYSRNTRTHSTAQLNKLADSIREFGFVNPVLIDKDNTLIAGHGRIEAARMVGMERVPAVRIEHMSDAQRRAYVIADNRLALDAGWDNALLALELAELAGAGFSVAKTGMDAKETTELFKLLDDSTKVDLFVDEQLTDGDAEAAVLKEMLWFKSEGSMELPIIRQDRILELPDHVSIWCGPDISADMPSPWLYMARSDSTKGLDWTKTIYGFYTDDYRFESYWDKTTESVLKLKKLGIMGALGPNFSVGRDSPLPIRLHQVYKARYVTRYMQEMGIPVAPDVEGAFGDFEWVCAGLKGLHTVSFQLHQTPFDDAHKVYLVRMVDYLIDTIKPKTLLLYATEDRLSWTKSFSKCRVVRVEPRAILRGRKAQTKKAEVN